MLDVIASPSRLAVVRRLGEAPGSSAPDLAAATNLHLNTVRAKLEALEGAGLVERVTQSTGKRGRPAVRYRLRGSAVPEGEELLPLGALLADALVSLGPKAEAACRTEGVAWGRRWSRRLRDESPSDRVCSALERLGFTVAREEGRVRLGGCPCPLVCGSNPQLVCGLADAVTDGVLEGTPVRAGRRRHDPGRRSCETTLVAA
jgi:predicted ArsR family transcriptional regulator